MCKSLLWQQIYLKKLCQYTMFINNILFSFFSKLNYVENVTSTSKTFISFFKLFHGKLLTWKHIYKSQFKFYFFSNSIVIFTSKHSVRKRLTAILAYLIEKETKILIKQKIHKK